MATAPLAIEPRNVLLDIPWRMYEALRDNPKNYHLRMTYDRGTLEIMSPSPRHEGCAHVLGLVLFVWTQELRIPVRGLRTMTYKRKDRKKGIEPDNCYYVQHEQQMRGKDEFDLTIDPPPDLAIEIEITESSVKKMPIYAALGVPELWRCDGHLLRIYQLVDRNYESCEGSACFPRFPVAKAEEILRRIGEVDETELLLEFRRWVAEELASRRE